MTIRYSPQTSCLFKPEGHKLTILLLLLTGPISCVIFEPTRLKRIQTAKLFPNFQKWTSEGIYIVTQLPE
jgi:hypothetical protein